MVLVSEGHAQQDPACLIMMFNFKLERMYMARAGAIVAADCHDSHIMLSTTLQQDEAPSVLELPQDGWPLVRTTM